MIRLALSGLLLSAVCLAPGCGGSGPTGPTLSIEEQNKTKSKADLKARLTEIATSGVGGSATAGMSSGIEELRAQDAKLADSLAADLKKLEAATTPADVKKIASGMAAKL